MKVFVINLARRSDRLQRMQRVLPDDLEVEFTTLWDGPLDGLRIDIQSLQGYGLFPWQLSSPNKWWNRALRKGEIGCSISHWLCWAKAQTIGDQSYMILEDDTCFAPEFMTRLSQGMKALTAYDPGWGLLYLGRVPLEPDTPAMKSIVMPGYSHCTFAYVVTSLGIDKLLATSFDKAIIPVDEFLPAMYIDHPRDDVRRRYPKCLSAYAFDPPIAYQLPKSVAGSDTEASDFIDPS